MIAGIAWSAALAVSARAGGPMFERYQAAVVSVLIVAAAGGLILLLLGSAPTEGVHLLYAAVAIVLVPLARSFLGRTSGRGAASLLLVTFAVLGALMYRLFTTG